MDGAGSVRISHYASRLSEGNAERIAVVGERSGRLNALQLCGSSIYLSRN